MDLFRVVVDFSASRQSDDDDDPDHQEPVQCKQPASLQKIQIVKQRCQQDVLLLVGHLIYGIDIFKA